MFLGTSVLPSLVTSHLIHNMKCPGLKAGEYLGIRDAPDGPAFPMPVSAVAGCVVSETAHGLPLASQQAVMRIPDSSLLSEQTEAQTQEWAL